MQDELKYKWRKWKRKNKGYRFLTKNDQNEVRNFFKYLIDLKQNKGTKEEIYECRFTKIEK